MRKMGCQHNPMILQHTAGLLVWRISRYTGKMMIRNKPVSSVVQEVLKGFASGRVETQDKVKRFLEGEDKQAVLRLVFTEKVPY